MAKDLDNLFESGVDLDQTFESGQDIATEEVPQQGSTLGDVAMGAHQGMTLGFADELRGLGKAFGSKLADTDFARFLAGVQQPTEEQTQNLQGLQMAPEPSFGQEYRQGQQEAQAEYDQAKQSSPYAYRGAEFFGGLIPGLASGGLAKAAPVLTGAVGGGLSAAGSSQATIEDSPGQLALETGLGTGLGAGLGKLFSPKVKAPTDITTASPLKSRLSKAVEFGEQGLKLSDKPAAIGKLVDKLKSNVQQVSEKLLKPRETLGREISQTLKKAGEEGIVLSQSPEQMAALSDIQSIIASNARTIGRNKTMQILDKVNNLQKGLLSPEEAYTLRNELKDLYSKIPMEEYEGIVKPGLEKIKGMLEESVPEFQGKLADYHKFLQAGPESLLARGQAPEVAGFLSKRSNAPLDLGKEVEKVLEDLRSGGQNSIQSYKGFRQMINRLKQLGKENPELLKRIRIDPASLEREILNKADEAAIIKGAAGIGLSDLPTGLKGPLGLGSLTEKAALKGANLYGQVKGAVKGRMNGFFSSSSQELDGAAQKLIQSGDQGLQSFGEALQLAVQTNDLNKKNAILFALLQQPKARELLGIPAGGDQP